jgi:hypothetical protein
MNKRRSKQAASEEDLFVPEQSPGGFFMVNRAEQYAANRILSDSARRVLSALMSFADTATGECFPSREAIADFANIHPAHRVSYATAELEAAGYIEVNQTGKRKCNSYRVRKVMYLQGVHHPEGDVPENGTPPHDDVPENGTPPRGDVPENGTGDVPENGTSLSNKNHLTRIIYPRSTKSKKAGSQATEVYEHYCRRVRAGARADAIRSIEKLLKDHPAEELLAAINRYAGNGMPKDAQYRIQANNFFGKAARFEDYMHGAQDKSTDDADELVRLN